MRETSADPGTADGAGMAAGGTGTVATGPGGAVATGRDFYLTYTFGT